MSKKVYLKNFGCQMNVRDSEVICGLLKAEGCKLTTDPDEADIIIFNTCSVRQHAEDKVWSEIGRIAKVRKNNSSELRAPSSEINRPIIGLVGCMAQNYKEQVFERAPQVDFAVGPSDIAKIPGIIGRLSAVSPRPSAKNLYETKIWETDGELRPEEIYHTGYYEDKEHAYVVISEGCLNLCSYCVVPYVRGPLQNRHYNYILREIEEAVSKGITKVTLLGQNVNAYESPIKGTPEHSLAVLGTPLRGIPSESEVQLTRAPVDFIELLKLVNNIKGLKEFSFITSHPRDTSVELFKAMAACDKLKKYLHLPVQSGSDKVLEKMNRGYTRKFYLDLVDNYRKIVKGGILSSDIIVGFSQESKEDFRQTYDLVTEAQFDSAYIFKYSPRPHSEAYNWMDDVSREEKEKRHKMILDLQKKISLKKKTKGVNSNDKIQMSK